MTSKHTKTNAVLLYFENQQGEDAPSTRAWTLGAATSVFVVCGGGRGARIEEDATPSQRRTELIRLVLQELAESSMQEVLCAVGLNRGGFIRCV